MVVFVTESIFFASAMPVSCLGSFVATATPLRDILLVGYADGEGGVPGGSAEVAVGALRGRSGAAARRAFGVPATVHSMDLDLVLHGWNSFSLQRLVCRMPPSRRRDRHSGHLHRIAWATRQSSRCPFFLPQEQTMI